MLSGMDARTVIWIAVGVVALVAFSALLWARLQHREVERRVRAEDSRDQSRRQDAEARRRESIAAGAGADDERQPSADELRRHPQPHR